jgi:hypothetical protein
LAQLLEEQKNLKMFNKEFKDKLVLKKNNWRKNRLISEREWEIKKNIKQSKSK